MNQNAIDQIHLCLNELQMVKQLLDLKVADDFCSRLLGIYVMMRVDDITKIWSHNISKATMERTVTDGVKSQYNAGLRAVRDKLGAHYQTPDGEEDLFGSIKIFKSIDYANTTCLIDLIMEVEAQIEGRVLQFDGFKDASDLQTAKEVLEELFSDDKAFLTIGALDVFGVNKGSLISCSKPQVKAQYLRSIETMVGTAQSFLKRKYNAVETERMFKRLYVSMVYNYHDNLITRTDIKDKAVQYEEGFDIQFKKLISKNDDRAMLETAFCDYETKYQVEPVIRKYRGTRNEACAHLDENSNVDDINRKLDALNISELKRAYDDMLMMFNWICGNVFCLKMMNLPARIPLHGSQMVMLEDNDNFYGEEVNPELPEEMNPTEIMRSIRRKDKRFDEACDALRQRLMSHNVEKYDEMVEVVARQLKEPSISDNEMSVIFNTMRNSTGGYPERLQRTIISMMADDAIFRKCGNHLLWLFSIICREDKEIDIPMALEAYIANGNIIMVSFAILAYLHLTVEKERTIYASKKKAHEVSEKIKQFCDGVKQPIEKCAIMIMLSQHWFHGQEYSAYRSYECKYSEYFETECTKALNGYFAYCRLKDKEEKERCENFLKTKHYLLLLNRLVVLEKARNQKPNVFLEMWRHNCYVWYKTDVYEALGVGIMCELDGNVDLAKSILEEVRILHPLNNDVKATLDEFYQRNPEKKS